MNKIFFISFMLIALSVVESKEQACSHIMKICNKQMQINYQIECVKAYAICISGQSNVGYV
jgi:hypothetical protein